ncbi:MAG: prepilin peptidase [Myxococcota bacterium]|nr:prepilin peptidase [Myxococcota bacterium]
MAMIEEFGAPFISGSALAFGLVVGSFLNVVIHRLPLGESVVSPRSRCPGCQTPISAGDNIPVLSYIALRGRCRHCGAGISLRYPAVEAVTGILFVAMAWRFGPTPLALLFMAFAAALVAAAMIDLDHQIIPDEISLGGLAVGLACVPVATSFDTDIDYASALVHSGLGALIGAGFLWSVGFFHARLSVALGRKFSHWPGEGEALPRPGQADYWLWFPGLGFGDVKLLAMIGAFVGPWGVLDTLLSASIIGLLVGVIWGLIRRDLSSPFGFGPALAVGAIFSVFVPLQELWLRFLVAGASS